MNSEFNKWWDADDLTTQGNNFVDGTPAYWAWEGWCAAVKIEREAIAKVCDETAKKYYPSNKKASSAFMYLASTIRFAERGKI